MVSTARENHGRWQAGTLSVNRRPYGVGWLNITAPIGCLPPRREYVVGRRRDFNICNLKRVWRLHRLEASVAIPTQPFLLTPMIQPMPLVYFPWRELRLAVFRFRTPA
jgi:hypothetical protein